MSMPWSNGYSRTRRSPFGDRNLCKVRCPGRADYSHSRTLWSLCDATHTVGGAAPVVSWLRPDRLAGGGREAVMKKRDRALLALAALILVGAFAILPNMAAMATEADAAPADSYGVDFLALNPAHE